MILHEAAIQYLVYLKATRHPSQKMNTVRSALSNIEWFYGRNLSLDAFDESTTLEYVKINDPFDCDRLHEERGEVFCNFTEWLMANKLIPAWSASGNGTRCRNYDSSETFNNWAA